jgi:hypothetical protein
MGSIEDKLEARASIMPTILVDMLSSDTESRRSLSATFIEELGRHSESSKSSGGCIVLPISPDQMSSAESWTSYFLKELSFWVIRRVGSGLICGFWLHAVVRSWLLLSGNSYLIIPTS